MVLVKKKRKKDDADQTEEPFEYRFHIAAPVKVYLFRLCRNVLSDASKTRQDAR